LSLYVLSRDHRLHQFFRFFIKDEVFAEKQIDVRPRRGCIRQLGFDVQNRVPVIRDDLNLIMAGSRTWAQSEAGLPSASIAMSAGRAPIKYCLKLMKLIKTDELRLPLTTISERLEKKLGGLLRSL
jgi:hypothetical protein